MLLFLVTNCKDPSHFLFSGFVYCYLHNPFSSYIVNILNVSYYLTIERDLVQVGLMSKEQIFYNLTRLLKPAAESEFDIQGGLDTVTEGVFLQEGGGVVVVLQNCFLS